MSLFIIEIVDKLPVRIFKTDLSDSILLVRRSLIYYMVRILIGIFGLLIYTFMCICIFRSVSYVHEKKICQFSNV